MKSNQWLKGSFCLLTSLVIVCVILVNNGLCSWFSKPWREVTLSPDEAYQKLSTSKKISFKGKIKRDTISKKSSIWIGDECVGGALESGIFNTKVTVVSGETDFFSIAYGDLTVDGEITATTFSYHSPDDDIIGYAQETVMTFKDGSREYVFLFYDKNKTRKPYYLYRNKIYNPDGKILAAAEDNFKTFSLSSKYELILTFYDENIDIEDRLFLYIKVLDAIEARIIGR